MILRGLLIAYITVCYHIEKSSSMQTSLEHQFSSAIYMLNPVDKWELKWVLQKDDEEYLFVILVADSA